MYKMIKLVLLILISSSVCLVLSLQIIKSDCEILNSQGKVVKEEYEQNTKNLIRICEGLVKIKKCEGKCSSSLQPSFNSPNGFQKNCVCCKETKLRRVDHVLNNCFDINGNKLEFGNLATMTISIQEPENCKYCELRKVLHEFQLPGCLKKIIPTFGCQGMCHSYVQISSSKFWELERSCNCCQDMGQKERTVTIECPQRDVKEMQVVIRAPLGCVCRQCTDVTEVQPQEYASTYLGYNNDQFEESIAFV